MKIWLTVFFLFIPSILFAQTWEQETLDLINQERANADARELALYGELYYGPRLPLKYHDGLEDSAQWWCNALRNTRWFDHVGLVNANGFLVDSTGKQIGTIWLPSYNMPGKTFWADRNRFLGINALGSSENGLLVKTSNVSSKYIVNAWFHGYNIDPRQAKGHYSNLIHPLWTHYGVAKNGWGQGKTSVFSEYGRIIEE